MAKKTATNTDAAAAIIEAGGGVPGVDTGGTPKPTEGKGRTYDQATITKLVNTFNTTYFALHERQDADMRLYELEKYVLDPKADNVTFNEPRHYGDMCIQLLEAAVPVITVHDEDENVEKENTIEEFHISMFKSADEWLADMLEHPIKGTLSFWGTNRGWMSKRVTIYRDNTGRLVPAIMPLDPRYVSWGIGMGGLKWAAYTTYRDADSVLTDYGHIAEQETVKVTDFWCAKENVILIDDVEIQRKKHNIGYPPFIIFPVTTTPRVLGENAVMAKSYLKGWGESIYAANRDLYKQLNKILTVWMTLIVKANKPGGFLRTEDQNLVVEETPYGSGNIVTLPWESEWIPLEPADIARSTPELFGQIASAIQRGGFPWVQYGQLWKGQELSGTALEELKEGINKILTPLLVTLGLVYSKAARMVEDQFLSYGTEWLAQGDNTRGKHFYRAIEPGDLEGNHEIKYEFLSITPQEEVANYAKAQMMKQTDPPLAPDSFIRKEIIKFQNPEQIEEDLDLQEIRNSNWKLKTLHQIELLTKRGREMEAQILSKDFANMLQMEMAQQAMAMAPPQMGTSPQTGTRPQLSAGAPAGPRPASPGPPRGG